MDADKVSHRAVVGALRLRRKDAARQLVHAPVIDDTLTALAFPGAGFVGAGALCQVLLQIAFHVLFTSGGMIAREKYNTDCAKAKGHRYDPVALWDRSKITWHFPTRFLRKNAWQVRRCF
jgi:hypothetical protein